MLQPVTDTTRCRAFSRLVADRRFAQLGLLLMGILAQVHTALRWITGDIATKKRRGDNEEEEEEGDGDQIEDDEAVEAEALGGPPEDEGDDLGEVIARVEDSDDEDTKPQPTFSSIKKELPVTNTTTTSKSAKKRPRQEVDSDDDASSHIKSLKSLAKPSMKSSEAERVARSEKKRKVEEHLPISRPKEIKEVNEVPATSEKREKDKKEKKDKEKDKEKDKSKKIKKKKKKGGDEFDDLFSGLL